MSDHDPRRTKGIGASDVAAILGVPGTYRTAYEVWLDKTGQAPTRKDPLDLFEVGHVLEPAVCLHGEKLAIDLGSGTDPAGHQPDFVRHANGILQGHPDWRVGRAIVESKAIIHGSAPAGGKLQWEFQARTYMLLLNCDFAVLPMLDIPRELPTEAIGMLHRLADDPAAMLDALHNARWARLSHAVYQRDPRIDRIILDRSAAWWQRHVVDGEPVPPDGSEGARLHLLASHPPVPKEDRVERRADDMEPLVRRYADAVAAEKAAAAEKDEAGQLIMAAIGDDYGIRGTGWRATWSRWDRKSVDWDRLRAERPDVAAVLDEYETTSPAGRLNVRVD